MNVAVALSNSNKIILSGVLRSTTPDDVRKAIVKAGVTDIQDGAHLSSCYDAVS